VIPLLDEHSEFPSIDEALDDSTGLPGLLAASRSISVERLSSAYRRGIFPWYSDGQPVLWWSPDPRMVLHMDEFHCGHGLRRALNKASKDPAMEFGFDLDFRAVMRACANANRTGQNSTWITDMIRESYATLHEQGDAHSFELRSNGDLVGGGYGVSLGRMFYGESMFAVRTDASKIALCGLTDFLSRHGFRIIDCQQNTHHLASLGAREISRSSFIETMTKLQQQPRLESWPKAWPLSSPAERFCKSSKT
jgi:leucyl/phenylalanyl-tRNA--protein transferase